jgi:transketolase
MSANEMFDQRTLRNRTDLRSPKSFDHVGRDVNAKGFVAGRVLAELAEHDERIVCASADLKFVTHMAIFEQRHPRRFFQFGVAERNMMSAAAGLATCGLIPYVSTFAAFSAILGYEVIRTDLAYPNLPVRVIGTHCGISMGFFGSSHHATEDISALRAIAGLTILSPSDPTMMEALLRATVDHPGPIYFRVGRGREPVLYPELPAEFAPGAPHEACSGSDVLIVATGIMVGFAISAAAELAREGISATVLDVHTLKPFDAESVVARAATHRAVLTIEEHNVVGGLGAMVAEAMAAAAEPVAVFAHGLHDEFSLVGPPMHLYRWYGLDADGIATLARRALERVECGSRGGETLWDEADRAQARAALATRPGVRRGS